MERKKFAPKKNFFCLLPSLQTVQKSERKDCLVSSRRGQETQIPGLQNQLRDSVLRLGRVAEALVLGSLGSCCVL
jgi:hypothetical protein